MKINGPNHWDPNVVEDYQTIINDYKIATKHNSIKLIRLVRNKPLLYNSSVDGYNDKFQKEYVWDTICKDIFPHFENLDNNTKDIIRENVRRRWKSLRDIVAREVKKRPTVEKIIRKRSDPLFAELEFVIPFIRNSEKLVQELKTFYESQIEQRIKRYKQEDKLVERGYMDLDIKKEIKNEPGEEKDNMETQDSSGNPVKTSNVADQSETPRFNWSTEFCTVAEYKGGEFTNSTVLCTSRDLCDNSFDDPMPHSPTGTESLKRTSTDHDDSSGYHDQISQVLSNIESREMSKSHSELDYHDEDRMFLMSLVSELKMVSPAKKMMVKAEIARIIANAMI